MAVASIASVMGKIENCSRYHTVKPGDTCGSICVANDVSTYQFEHVNNATVDAACDNLKAGERMCLGIKGQDCTTTYVVQTGDTCDDIVACTGVDKSILLANNPNIDINGGCDLIAADEVLCVAKYDVYAPAVVNHKVRMTFKRFHQRSVAMSN